MNVLSLLNDTPSPPSPPSHKRSINDDFIPLKVTTKLVTAAPSKRPRLTFLSRLPPNTTNLPFSTFSDSTHPSSPSHVAGWVYSSASNTEELSIASTVTESPDCDQIVASASRLAQSRIVGHRHRANERERTVSLNREIGLLRDEIDLLKCRIPNKISLPEITPTLHRLSLHSADVLGADCISGATALLLLEIIALRRNIYDASSAMSLECPEAYHVNDAVEHCVKVAELEGNNSPCWTIHMLHTAARLHERWAGHESICARVQDKPRRENCSGCRKFCTSGSGHQGCTLDDRNIIGSLIEYRDDDLSDRSL